MLVKPKNIILTNLTSDNDLEFILKIFRWYLKPLGIYWPPTTKLSTLERYIASLLITICSLLLIFILVPGLIILTKVSDPVMKLKICGPISFCILAIIKYYALIMRRKNIAQCFRHIKNDWQRINSNNDRNTMIDYAQFGRYGAMFCAIFMYSGGIFFAGILPHLSASALKNQQNITIRPFAYPVYFEFFNPHASPAYEILFSIQCCCAFVMHSISSVCCSLVIVFVMHIIGQLEIIIAWLKNFVDNRENNQKNKKTLSDIIYHHVRTLR